MFDLEGYSVYVLTIQCVHEEPEIWGIYSNAKACQEHGEKVCQAYAKKGKEALYWCDSYEVKGE